MRKLLKKLLPCLLLVFVVFGVTACQNGNNKYPHPSVEPNIENGANPFLTLGEKTITNQAVYNRLLQTYGLDQVIAWMDEITLKDQKVDEEAFEEQLNYIIYGTTDLSDLTDEEKAEKEKAHSDKMYAQGYKTEEAWMEYYRLEYKRYAYGLAEFEKHVDKLNESEKTQVFSEEDYEVAYDTIYQSDYTVIILTFDSEYEAKQILTNHGIDVNNLTFGWTKVHTGKDTCENCDLSGRTCAKLTAQELKDTFTSIHREMNPGVEVEQTYKFIEKQYRNELSDYSATIANKVAALDAFSEETYEGAYTHAPLAFGSRFFLALKVSETEVGEYATATEEQVAEVKKYLLETAISSAFLLVSAQQKAALKIYDEGLEIGYKAYYNANISEAKLELDEYVTTNEENSSVVAEFTFNGQKYSLTADELFERLLEKYGPALALLYTQEYIILSNPAYNKITNLLTGEVLDQETYDKYYKTDVKAYKDALEKGDYASKGYPANYGWENFRLDYLGAQSDEELMHLYGGSIYSAAEGYFIKDIYMEEEKTETDEEGNETVIPADHLVQAEMDKIFAEYFSASMIGVYAFYDKDENGLSNGLADEMDATQEALAKELVELAYTVAKEYKAQEMNGTLAKALEKVVKEYKSTPYFATSKWTKYKVAGLQLTLVSSTTYTNTSTANENILAEAEKQWKLVEAFKTNADANPKKVEALGQTLDPGFRNVTESVTTYVTSEFFADQSEAFIANDAAYRLVITKAFDHTYIKKSSALFKPTLKEYEDYTKDTSNVSSAVATAIKTYYTTAISNLTTTEIISNLLFTNCKELINNETVKFVGMPELKDTTLTLINQSLKDSEE